MPERRRFLIAVSGIGICLLIAAGILFTTPSVLVVDAPSPRVAAVLLPAPLPRLPVPIAYQPAGLTAPRPNPSRAMAPRVATPRLHVAEPRLVAGHVVPDVRLPAEPLPPAPATLSVRARPIPVAGVPAASGRSVPRAEDESQDHGAVTAAFVTAGAHVGQGFRTFGRTLKNLF